MGTYAAEQVRSLEDKGTVVQRIDITPMQRGGWKLGRSGPVRAMFREARTCDALIVHFQVWMYRDGARRSQLVKYLWPQLVLLAFLLRFGRRTTMVVHEYRYKLYTGPGAFLQYPLVALLFWLPRHLVFHTPQEAKGFRRQFLRRRRVSIQPHHGNFRPRVHLSRNEARQRLDLDPAERLVLAIGFYKVHKGFPAFAHSFASLTAAGQLPKDARLHIVTSLQDDGDGAATKELAALQSEFASSPSVVIHEGFLDDEAFDAWLAAADVVALPYKSAYSSGVAARARVLGRPLLVSAAGGLPDQAGSDGAVYRDEADIASGLQRLFASDSAIR